MPLPPAGPPLVTGVVLSAMLPEFVGAAAATAAALEGTVIKPLFIVAVAVAMVCSLYVCQTGMFKMSSYALSTLLRTCKVASKASDDFCMPKTTSVRGRFSPRS